MGLLYEAFEPGQTFDHAGTVEITQDANAAFCKLTHNNQPLHLDRDAAVAAGFRDILVNGLYTFSASVGLSVPDLTEGTLVANLGYDDVRHPSPVYPGDVLSVRSEVLEKRPTSKPGRGIVKIQHTVSNQDGTVVCSYSRSAMVRMESQ